MYIKEKLRLFLLNIKESRIFFLKVHLSHIKVVLQIKQKDLREKNCVDFEIDFFQKECNNFKTLKSSSYSLIINSTGKSSIMHLKHQSRCFSFVFSKSCLFATQIKSFRTYVPANNVFFPKSNLLMKMH